MKRKSDLILILLIFGMLSAIAIGPTKAPDFPSKSDPTSPDHRSETQSEIAAIASPWLCVDPASITLGPELSLGKTFDVGVGITGPPPIGLDANWNTIGACFRLFFDDALIEPVNVSEGPFFRNPAWNKYGTFFLSLYEHDGLGPHLLVGELILPNSSSGIYDQTSFPNGTDIIANITFKVIKQGLNPLECDLTLAYSFNQSLLDKDGIPIPMDDPAQGHYKILPAPTIEAKTYAVPEALDLNIKRENLTIYIQLPEAYDENDIILSSVSLNSTFRPINTGTIGHHTRACTLNHTNLDLMLTFNRTEIVNYLLSQHITYGNITLTVTGQLNDATPFKGQVEIGVRILPGDSNCDSEVDMKDCYIVAKAFGESPCRARWNGFADLDENERTDLKDYYAAIVNFGKP